MKTYDPPLKDWPPPPPPLLLALGEALGAAEEVFGVSTCLLQVEDAEDVGGGE